MNSLRLMLTEAMIEADASDPLVALHISAAIGALNQHLQDRAAHGAASPAAKPSPTGTPPAKAPGAAGACTA